MHPRNIYNTRPNFKELATIYPHFSRVCQVDISGKVKIDFKDPNAVRVLSQCCLHKDFQLDIELPPHKLLPTIPLRVNYLLWIEDLLKHVRLSGEISGIDIGCGASCIYCLLAVRLNSAWKMFALEIDEESVKFANENIAVNNLNDNVFVISQGEETSLFGKLFQKYPLAKSFCICNPPFFCSQNEVNGENRTGKRKRLRPTTGSSSELVYGEGGELGFINKIIDESLHLRSKIEIYTSMLGCKKNLQKVIDQMRKLNIESYTFTTLVQGRTIRWAIAWSFVHDLSTFTVHSEQLKKLPIQVPKTFKISNIDFDSTKTKLRQIFNDLKICVKEIEEKIGQLCRWELTATHNTWSNQRRKKRAGIKATDPTSQLQNMANNLHIAFEVRKIGESCELQMVYISGSMTKDSVNQVMQFVKNKFSAVK